MTLPSNGIRRAFFPICSWLLHCPLPERFVEPCVSQRPLCRYASPVKPWKQAQRRRAWIWLSMLSRGWENKIRAFAYSAAFATTATWHSASYSHRILLERSASGRLAHRTPPEVGLWCLQEAWT